MYAYFKGLLVVKREDSVILEVNNIGYNLFMPKSSLEQLPHTGNIITVYTYTYVKEDALQLYGFLTHDDLTLFKMLLTVSGIGPKGALGILSTLSCDDLRFAILSEDAKAIAKSPGIGAKTAQKVVIELKDKISLEDTIATRQENVTARVSGTSPDITEAVEALVSLGYSSSDALKAVRQIEGSDQMGVEAILKEALKKLTFL